MPVALLLPLLLLALNGEALPVSSCHDCLKDDGPLLTDASNLRNFQSVARGMDAFCEANARVHKCLDDCSTDREAVTTQLSFANFLCSTKVEEFRLIGECLGEDGSDSLSKCSDDCGADQQTALRFDSSSASPINPTALLDSLEGVCAQQLCVLNCASHDLNRRCAGSGGLLKDLARRQVVDGSEILAAQSANGSNPAAQELAQRYVADLPGGCAFVKDPEVFDKVAVDTAPEETETETGSEFATESSDIPTFSLNPDLIGAFDDVSGASGESGEAEGSGFQSSGEDASGEDLPPISPPEVPEDVDDEPSGEEPTAAPPQTTETVLTVNDEKERQLETNRVDIGGADSFKSPSQASSRSAAAVVAVLPLLAFFF